MMIEAAIVSLVAGWVFIYRGSVGLYLVFLVWCDGIVSEVQHTVWWPETYILPFPFLAAEATRVLEMVVYTIMACGI